MKMAYVAVGLVMAALAGCDRVPTQEGAGSSAVAAVQGKAPLPKAQPLAETQVERDRKLPLDVPVLADQLATFDAAFKSGDINAYDYTFDPSTRFLAKYPIWTDLDCQVDEQRPNGIWCAHGPIGEPEDRELEAQLPFIGNEDLLVSALRCSEILCINHEGNPVGVIQPEMRLWINANCSRSPDLHLACR